MSMNIGCEVWWWEEESGSEEEEVGLGGDQR